MHKLALLVVAVSMAVAACGNGSSGRFQISGKVKASAAAKPGVISDGKVTHVMAVTPSSQDAQRVLAPVASDGTFDIEVDPARPWVIVFIDAERSGADMVLGVFKAETLDTLPPLADSGKVDLGNVTIVDGGASGDVTYTALLAALGIDAATAIDIGALDDLCLRYVNPDIDGDGVLDGEQEGHRFGLDFHVGFAMQVQGRQATVADLLGAYLPADTAISYGGTGIYVSYPKSFSSAAGGVTFDEPATVQTFDTNGGSIQTFPAGTLISSAQTIHNDYGDMRSFGVFAAAGHDLPQGAYRFSVGGVTLTFTRVRTPSAAELAAARDFIMPFIRFMPVDPACTSACAIAAIDYNWMRRKDAGWVDASVGDLALVTGDEGGFISIRRGTDSEGGEGLGLRIPNDTASGSIPWTSTMTSDEICHLGLSYDDKLGMRYFSGIANSPGTCPVSKPSK